MRCRAKTNHQNWLFISNIYQSLRSTRGMCVSASSATMSARSFLLCSQGVLDSALDPWSKVRLTRVWTISSRTNSMWRNGVCCSGGLCAEAIDRSNRFLTHPFALFFDRSVKITDEGRKALLQLSKGDMRRALNILQACHAGYDIVDEDAVYNCTGNPHPADIDTIVNSMLTEDFTTAYSSAYSLLIRDTIKQSF